MATIFLSDAIRAERLHGDAAAPDTSSARQHWRRLAALYRASLTASGLAVIPCQRPEIYQTDIARDAAGFADGDWHLAVKPIADIRPFHGVPNVFVCDWPYPELSRSSHDVSPFFDQARLLGRADAVLCCTEFTAATLQAAGIARAVYLPPCFAPRPPAPAAADRDGTTTVLMHADPDRLSVQLGAVLEAFAQARSGHDGLRLQVQLDAGNSADVGALPDGVTLGFDEPGRADARPKADFVLGTSAASGLPIRIVEAMLAGIPVVTPLHAGIAGLLGPDSAVPVATAVSSATADEEPLAGVLALTCHRPTVDGLVQAFLTAAGLPDDARMALGAAGRRVAEARFGLAAFRAGLAALELRPS